MGPELYTARLNPAKEPVERLVGREPRLRLTLALLRLPPRGASRPSDPCAKASLSTDSSRAAVPSAACSVMRKPPQWFDRLVDCVFYLLSSSIPAPTAKEHVPAPEHARDHAWRPESCAKTGARSHCFNRCEVFLRHLGRFRTLRRTIREHFTWSHISPSPERAPASFTASKTVTCTDRHRHDGMTLITGSRSTRASGVRCHHCPSREASGARRARHEEEGGHELG